MMVDRVPLRPVLPRPPDEIALFLQASPPKLDILVMRLRELLALAAAREFYQLTAAARPPACPACKTLAAAADRKRTADSRSPAPPSRCVLLSADDCAKMLIEQSGRCKSCELPLCLYQVHAPQQPVNVVALADLTPTRCRTAATITSLVCQGCSALLEACWCSRPIFNTYRQILFATPSDRVAAVYLPSLDDLLAEQSIDGENAADDEVDNEDSAGATSSQTARYSVRLIFTSLKQVGGKRNLCRLWQQQQGLAACPLPPDLRGAVPCGNLFPAALPDHTLAADDLSSSDFLARRPPAQSASDPDEPEPLMAQSADCWVFAVPIDPRKSVRGRSLSALALMPRDPSRDLAPDNCLLTTQLLASLQRALGYDAFIRWALTTFRCKPPTFVPRAHTPAGQHVLPTAELEALSAVFAAEQAQRKQMSVHQAKLRALRGEAKAIQERCTPMLLPVVESSQDLSVLAQYGLCVAAYKRAVAQRSAASQAGTQALTPELVAKHLPELIERHVFGPGDAPSSRRPSNRSRAADDDVEGKDSRAQLPATLQSQCERIATELFALRLPLLDPPKQSPAKSNHRAAFCLRPVRPKVTLVRATGTPTRIASAAPSVAPPASAPVTTAISASAPRVSTAASVCAPSAAGRTTLAHCLAPPTSSMAQRPALKSVATQRPSLSPKVTG